MHQSALMYGKRFFDTYCSSADEHRVVLDIGSQDVNGSLRDVCPVKMKYIGVDFAEGKGVDVILKDPYKLPFDDETADVVVCSSCFEHSEFFWLVLLEIMRVLKPDGLFYLNAPSNGFIHRWPVDCWRFYPDAGHALVAWARHNGYKPLLLESFVGGRSQGSISDGGMWNDFVAVILKDESTRASFRNRIVNDLADFSNGYNSEKKGELNSSSLGPDFALIDDISKTLDRKNIEHSQQIAALGKQTSDMEARHQAQVIELQLEAAAYLNRLHAMTNSRSWRLTAPLRRMAAILRRVPISRRNPAIGAYRALPISPRVRQILKNIVFRLFGFAFARSDAYRRWHTYRRTKSTWAASASEVSISSATPTVKIAGVRFPLADGKWEWSDYGQVKTRIEEIVRERKSKRVAAPASLVNITKDLYASAAGQIMLPEPPSKPDVSIILPVFNHLKFTLECLLSISANTGTGVTYEVIAADDASTDDTADILSTIPNLRFIRNKNNVGFLRNCNLALAHVNGAYTLYLNNDVQVTPGWLGTLLETFRSNKNVGAVGPKFVYPDGHLQEAGAAFRLDGTSDMIGLNENPSQARYSYARRVDYVSGACLMLPTELVKKLGGFSEEYLPCYCEDADLCLRVQEAGYDVYVNPSATIVHHLSKTTASMDKNFKLRSIAKNLKVLRDRWSDHIEKNVIPRIIAFYLPQFYPFPENEKWWGKGFTEWSNVTKAKPNFIGHYQPRLPSDLGFYDLRLPEVMAKQAALAKRYGVHGFCYYYYWFAGKRLLDRPIEQMLADQSIDMPFCLCWANENWTRRWDGQDKEVLIAQDHSPSDDKAVILDLIRYFRDRRYIRIDGRPVILVYRVKLFPNFVETARRWRDVCREQGIGEIYIAMVESFEMVNTNVHPGVYGCDAAVEFPPHGLGEACKPSGDVTNPDFVGTVGEYRDVAVTYATRELPNYTRFSCAMAGWDNTARMQNRSFCFEHSTPGAFQAWLEQAISQTRIQHHGDERLVFVNAWNEWAEGTYLEPDTRFGHTYLEAVKNALDAESLLRKGKYALGD